MDVRPSTVDSYDRIMRAIHWTTLLLVTAVFVAIWSADPELVGQANVRSIVQIHRSLGLTVCALTVFRLAWRWYARVPPLPGDLSIVQKWAARANEGLIYLLLLAQPVVGLLYSSAYAVHVNLFLLVQLPTVIARDPPLGEELGVIHSFLGYSLLALIALHAAAALFHHFVRRDDVLNAMLPARLRGAGRSGFALLWPKRQT